MYTVDTLPAYFMRLKVFVDGSSANKELYKAHIDKHNASVLANGHMADAGFDLLCLTECRLWKFEVATFKYNLGVKCSATIHQNQSAYYMYPRSSLSKTAFRLANSVGIVDAGYRGNLMGAFDILRHGDTPDCLVIKTGDRLLQICSPNLQPIYVTLVDSVEELGEKTIRGENGFGSTGGVAAAEPNVTEPEPNVVEPEPNVAEPEPNVVEPEPNVAEPEPNVAEPEPNIVEPEPNVVEPEPNIVEPEPNVAESEPII